MKWLATALGRAASLWPFDLRDLHVYGGVVLLAAAGAWVSLPLAAAIAGGLLLLIGLRVGR